MIHSCALRLWLAFACLLPSPAFAQLTVTSPVPRMVFQRTNYDEATLVVAGLAPPGASLVEARFVPLAIGQGTVTPWTSLDFLPGSKAYRGLVTVSSGWYRLDVRAKAGPSVLAQTQVNRVGVGEVFVIAGQSNAAGGFEREPGSEEDRVSCVDFRQDALDEQLLPLRFSQVSYGSSIGPSQPPHVWGRLGDKLVRRLNVPVLFLGAAQPGTSSDQWRQSATGGTNADGQPFPYRRLGVALQHYIARTGVRAILWHQGEGDIGSSESTYFDNLQYVIQKTRQQTGFDPLPWVVSRVSYTQGQTNSRVISAQNRLITSVHDVFAGPSTDDLTGSDNRLGDNVHLGGNGLSRFADRWDQALTDDFFSRSTPFTPTDESTLITSSYTLPLRRRPGETVYAGSLRSDPHEADNQYFTQLLRASDGSLVAESARGTDNPIALKLPANLPDGEYRLRTLSTHPATTGTLGEPFRVDYFAPSTGSQTPVLPNQLGGTVDSSIQRFGYRFEDGCHCYWAMVQASSAVEVRLERIDGGPFSDSDWRPAPPSSQAPDYTDFADYNYLRNYPPPAIGVGGVAPGRYRLSVRRQGDTGAGLWVETTLQPGRNTLFIGSESTPALPPVLTLTSLFPAQPCRGGTFSVAFEQTETAIGSGNVYSLRLSDADGSFANETILGTGTTSPLSATLPASLPAGTGYQLRLVASNPVVASAPSQSLTFCTPATTATTADLSLGLRVSSRTPAVGRPVTLTLTLTNAGPAPAANVTAQSLLPAGLTFVDAASPEVSSSGNVVSIDAGTLANGAIGQYVFRVKASQAGGFSTAAQIMTSSAPDPDSKPNSGTGDGQDDTAQIDWRTADSNGTGTLTNSPNPNQVILPEVQSSQPSGDPAKADLRLVMATNSLIPRQNQVVSLSLIVTNRGGSSASNVTVQTLLPTGWRLTDGTGLVVSGQSVTGTLAAIPAGGRAVLLLSVQPSSWGILRAQVLNATPTDPDSRPGNGYLNGEDDEASMILRTP